MKKLLLIWCFAAILLKVNAQITINHNDMPNIGDTIRLSNTIVPPLLNYQATGTNYTWDFSSLIFATQRVDTFISVTSTPLVYQLVFNNIFDPEHKATIVGLGPTFELDTVASVQNTYNFYKETTAKFTMVGYGATVNGLTIPVKFDVPELLYTFPLTMNAKDSSTSNFGQSIPNLGYFGEKRKRVNHVDGWGTLTTPYGTFPVIRVKSQVSYHDSINYNGTGYAFDRFETEYKWLGDNKGLPLLTITANTLGATASYIDSFRVHTIGIPEFKANIENNFTVYPNISNDLIKISIPPSKIISEVRIWNIEGRLLDKMIIKPSKTSSLIELSLKSYGLKANMYIVEHVNSLTNETRKVIFQP